MVGGCDKRHLCVPVRQYRRHATDWEQTAQLTSVDADHIEAVFKQKDGSFERAVIGFTKDGQLAQLTLVDHFGQTTTVVFTAFTRVEQSM